MTAETPVPEDHPLMIAWKAYQATEDYANSYRWATAAIEHVVLPEPKDPTANRYTHESYRQFVQGSLWGAFMAGFNSRTPRELAEENERLRATLLEIGAMPFSMVNDSESLRFTIQTIQQMARRAALSPAGGGK